MLLLLAWFSIYLLLIGSAVKKSPAHAGAVGSIPGLGRSSGEGNGNPLPCSSMGNHMVRGAWWVTVCGITKESGIAITCWIVRVLISMLGVEDSCGTILEIMGPDSRGL